MADSLLRPAQQRSPRLAPAGLAAVRVLLFVLVAEHAFSLFTPPYGIGVPQAFHLSFGLFYAWLAVKLFSGRPWTRVLVTVLLAIQFVGRFFVFAFIDNPWIRLLLIMGAVVTIVVVWMLWFVRPVRAFFR
ncbi:hypothetical protein OG470_29765 [Micromonospora sp. NBC_00389]|uniref:hypothetical protein n=1 Tax=Micromonospora sp. NBC_00389 TaxID=2903586 RepID=UPI002E2035AE